VWCDLTENELNGIIIKKKKKTFMGYLPAQFGHACMESTLKEVLPVLGKQLMTPLAKKLRQLKVHGTVLIPCGLLGALPLGAAFIEGSTSTVCHAFIDEIDVIYAPSALAWVSVCRQLVNINSDPKQDTLLCVGEPAHSNKHRLPLATIEAEIVSAYFSSKRQHLLRKEKATRKAIIDAAPAANVLHFACHGEFVSTNPLKSALFLAGKERLELADILNELSLEGSRLVVLSACQTAITDIKKLPDEVVGFPSGFLSAGVPGVVGTLWRVNDISTALLMERFYYLYRKKGHSPAHALCSAQCWLRNLTKQEFNKLFRKQQKKAQSRSSTTNTIIKKKSSEPTTQNSKEKPFSSPIYWASFTFHGI
jgi:CHAT domain-containing protein